MINKNSFLNLLLLLRKKTGGTSIRQTFHPRRDWLIGMFVFVLLVGIGSVESFRTFMRYKHIQTSVTGDSTKVVSYKQNAAVKALELYTKKRERLNALYDLPQIAPVVTTTVQQSIPETLSQNATQTPAIDSELLETIESEIAPEILPKPTLTD